MNLLLLLLRTSRATVVAAILTAILGGLSTVGVLIFVRRLMIAQHDLHTSSALVWGFFGACLGALLAKLVSQLLLIGLSRRTVARLTMHLTEHVLAAPLKRLENLGPTRVHMTLTQEVPIVVQGMNAIPVACANSAMIAACLIYLAFVSLPAFVLVVVVFAIGLPLQLLILLQARRHFDRAREGQESLLGRLRHLLEAVKELKIHRGRREAFLNQSLKASIRQQERQSYFRQLFRAVADSWGRLVLFVLLGLLLIALPVFIETDARMLGTYVLVVFFMMQPLGSLKAQLPLLAHARAALARVEGIGLALSESPERGNRERIRPITEWERLDLVDVTYVYRGKGDEPGFTLGPINLTFKPGELVFVGGGNGSGKSTFVKLLTGLYLPRDGEIRLNGETLAREELEQYRQLFSVVFSEFHLFSELHGLGSPELDDKVCEYLTKFELDQRVKIKQGTFSTTTRMSQGQRKRLALLVAYLEDRPFYVLDEWAADQDPHFKNVFYTQLLPELKARGKTVLVITHDDRFYNLADRLLLLEDGQFRCHEEAVPGEGVTVPEQERTPLSEEMPIPLSLNEVHANFLKNQVQAEKELLGRRIKSFFSTQSSIGIPFGKLIEKDGQVVWFHDVGVACHLSPKGAEQWAGEQADEHWLIGTVKEVVPDSNNRFSGIQVVLTDCYFQDATSEEKHPA